MQYDGLETSNKQTNDARIMYEKLRIVLIFLSFLIHLVIFFIYKKSSRDFRERMLFVERFFYLKRECSPIREKDLVQ